MSDAYRLLFFIILPLMALAYWLQPKEIDVTVCTSFGQTTYINRFHVSERTIDQMGLGDCKVMRMDREDYYKLRHSFDF